MVEQALDRFGRVDTLVNNAGIYIGKPFTDYTVDDYTAITSVNLAGFFHVTQRAIAQMLPQGGGHVVNLTTSLVEQHREGEPSALASLTKGGLDAVTRSLAIEYAAGASASTRWRLASSRRRCTTGRMVPGASAPTPAEAVR